MFKNFLFYIFIVVIVLYFISFTINQIKKMPDGLSVKSKEVFSDDVRFYSDLTYLQNDRIIFEHYIFEEVFSIIDKAEKFIVLDMFLYNDIYSGELSFPELSKRFTEQLIDKKRNNPEIEIVFITDPINNFYGSYEFWQFIDMKKQGIKVIETNLDPLRDSNPVYSSFWRLFLKWKDSSKGKAWLTNPLDPDGQKGKLFSFFRMLNFKANHRKLIITEKGGMIMSANPHDASAFNSNIAISFGPEFVSSAISSERAVVAISSNDKLLEHYKIDFQETNSGQYKIQLVTEKAIKQAVLEGLRSLELGDTASLAMFYLSDREIIKELINASRKGVSVLVVLDSNNNAFGRKKNGLPNRPVANELFKKSQGKINIRWYRTYGEQFHPKLISFKKKDNSVVIGGSANFTRRNLNNYNLESDLKIIASNDSEFMKSVESYFSKISSEEFSLGIAEFKHTSLLKYFIYYFQELSGFSTF